MKLYDHLLAAFDQDRAGYSAIAIIGQSCLGSVAAMLILMNHMVNALIVTELFLVTALCMVFNAAILIGLDSKTTVNLLIASVVCSLLMIVINLWG